MGLSAGVEVAGLREFQKGLKKLNPELDKSLKAELKTVAEVVADDARGRVPSKSGRARKSVRAGADAKGPYVQGGKASVPYYPWLDFGSRRAVSGHPRSAGPWFKSGAGPKKGRFIYPAIDENQARIIEGATQALETARGNAGI